MTTVAIHQPNYAPWLGYFQKIAQSDIFVFYDNVQMPMGKSYVSRNRFKSPAGAKWLTVPTPKSSIPKLIKDTSVLPGVWAKKHISSLEHWYANSPSLSMVCDVLNDAYVNHSGSIADLNMHVIQQTCRIAGLDSTIFVRASELEHGIEGAGSIKSILQELGAKTYLTGQGAGSMRYLDVDDLAGSGIATQFLSVGIAPYSQRHGEFEPGLSALDALLNVGSEKFRTLVIEADAV